MLNYFSGNVFSLKLKMQGISYTLGIPNAFSLKLKIQERFYNWGIQKCIFSKIEDARDIL